MNILITGASGFLGSALARKLGGMDHKVSLLVRKNTSLHRMVNLSAYKIGRCETDEEITQFISDTFPDVVIHTACCYGRNGESPLQIIDANIRFGMAILGALKGFDKRVSFINAGTVLSRNVSLYALTKIQFEELGTYISKASNENIQFVNIKLQHMYGPGDDPSKFTSYVIDACKDNVPALPLTLGEQNRDFVYIDDVVDAYVKVLENLVKLGMQQSIELGSGLAPRLREIVEIIHKLTNSKTKLLFGEIPYRENDEMFMVANIGALKDLGWSPKFDIEAGIRRIIEMDALR